MQSNPQPLVSVIIIFYNAERFLQEAIESVRAQTYPCWELLLVDDGSADGSTELARQYECRYPNEVYYLEHQAHENRGMSASRNLGVRNAQGKYLAFLDADDIWLPNILEDQVKILESQPEAALVYGPLFYWYSWGSHPEDRQRDYVEKLGVVPDALIRPPTLLPLFLQDRAAVPSGILVRREIVERYAGFEDVFRGEYEDQVFCAKICLHEPVFASSKCWYYYRQHADSCVSLGLRTGKTVSARLFFLTWLAEYISKEKVKSPQLWWAIHYERMRCRYPRFFHGLQYGLHLANRLNDHLRRGWIHLSNPS